MALELLQKVDVTRRKSLDRNILANGGNLFRIPANIDLEKKTYAWKRAQILNIEVETESILETTSTRIS